MRTPSRQVKKVLKEQYPMYDFSVTVTKSARDRQHLNVMILLPMELDVSTSLNISGNVHRFINESQDIRGWGYAFHTGCRTKEDHQSYSR